MSNVSSPSRRPAESDPFFESADYTAEISHKMRVPKHITAAGDSTERQDHWTRPGNFQEKFEMYVPDRILVVGQEQHIGTKAPPRELQLENAVLPPDPGFIRVQTPPRVISLDEHFIPAADEPTFNHFKDDYKSSPPTINGFASRNDYNKKMDTTMRETTPPNGSGDMSMNVTGLTPAEEVLHLRRQVVKLSRRVMAVELDLQQQQQRQQILLGLGIAYFLVKSIVWITRSS